MTVGKAEGASDATADGLSPSTPFVTMTRRGPSGSLSLRGLANASQNFWQVMQPLDKNATIVSCSTPWMRTESASLPHGLTPTRSAAPPNASRPGGLGTWGITWKSSREVTGVGAGL